MARWWNGLSVVAGGLLGMAGLALEACAQFPGPGMDPGGGGAFMPAAARGGGGGGIFASEPKPPQGPDFPNSAPDGDGPDFPNPAKKKGGSPFTLPESDDPNAFMDDLRPQYAEPNVFSLRAEYLRYKVAKVQVNTDLVTTSTSPNRQTQFGAIGQSGTVVLVGPGDYDYGYVNGGRVTMGFAPGIIPPVEFSCFWLNQNLTIFNESGDGSANSRVLARPVARFNFPIATDVFDEGVFPGNFPGLSAGGIAINSNINVWGFDVNTFLNLGASESLTVDVLLGYRFTRLSEGFSIRNDITSVDPTQGVIFPEPTLFPPNVLPIGFTTIVNDLFWSRNNFNGGQIGMRSILNFWRFNLLLDAKLAVGNTRQELEITGYSSSFPPTFPTRPGRTIGQGILAVPSNGSEFSRDQFTIIPELNLQVGFQLSRNCRLFGGFNILYWSRVLRPSEQITNLVDTRQAPTDDDFDSSFVGTVPGRNFKSTDFWAHGLNLGFEISF